MSGRRGNLDPGLVLVVQMASAFSLGTLAALVYSIKTLTPAIELAFSSATAIAFVLAAMGSVAFWYVAFQLSGEQQPASQGEKRNKLWLALLAGGLMVALIGGFVYPLRGLSREKVSEIGFGTFIAIIFLTVLGLLFWRVVRYLEAER